MTKRATGIWIVVFLFAGAAVLASAARLRAAERVFAEATASLEHTASQAREVERLRSASAGSVGGRTASPEAIDEALRRSGIGPDRVAVFRTGQAPRSGPRGQSNGGAPSGLTAVLELESITLSRLGEFLSRLDSPGPRWRAGRIDLDLSPLSNRCNVVIHLETP